MKKPCRTHCLQGFFINNAYNSDKNDAFYTDKQAAVLSSKAAQQVSHKHVAVAQNIGRKDIDSIAIETSKADC